MTNDYHLSENYKAQKIGTNEKAIRAKTFANTNRNWFERKAKASSKNIRKLLQKRKSLTEV